MRVLGLIYFVLCILSALLVRSRLPPQPGWSLLQDMRIFRQPAFALTTVGVFIICRCFYCDLETGAQQADSYQLTPESVAQELQLFCYDAFGVPDHPAPVCSSLAHYHGQLSSFSYILSRARLRQRDIRGPQG